MELIVDCGDGVRDSKEEKDGWPEPSGVNEALNDDMLEEEVSLALD